MYPKKIRYCALILILFTTTIVNSKHKQITIDECIDIALQNHPSIQVTNAEKKKALSNYKIAKAKRNISISAQLITEEYDDTTTSDSEIASTSFKISTGLLATYYLVNIQNQKIENASKIAINLSKIGYQKTRDTIILNVKTAYYNYLLTRENVIIHKQLLTKYKDKLELANKLFKSGRKPILDVSKARVTFAEAELEFEKAKNDEQSAKIELYSSMGLTNFDSDIYPRDIERLPTVKYSYKDLFRLAQLYYPGIQELKVQKDLAKMKIEIEKATRMPTIRLDLFFGYQNTHVYQNNAFRSPFDQDLWEQKVAPRIYAQMPLYLGGEITARIDNAINEYNKTVYKEREMFNTLQNKIRIYYRTLEVLLKQMEMAELVIKNANTHLLLASKSYEVGKSSLLNLQDAQARVLKAELQFLSVKYNYLLIIAQMSNMVGLSEDRICKKR